LRRRGNGLARRNAGAATPENVKLVFKSAENFEEKARKNAVLLLGASQAFAG
jgi:hypothetical protein